MNKFATKMMDRFFGMSDKILSPFLAFNSDAFPKYLWVRVGVLVTIVAFFFLDALSSLVKTWSSRNDFSHGFLVPVISLYFVWLEREKLKRLPVEPNLIGGALVTLAGGLALILGSVGAVELIQQLSIVVLIPGLVLMLLGARYLKALFLPLAYLFLAVPLTDIFDQAHWPFQLLTATISSTLLNSLGIPVFKNAQYLMMPNITLEVAPECSGLSYLISIIAIGIPLAYFTLRGVWQRVALVVLALIIGIFSNGLRVSLIGMWTYYGGKEVHGPLHLLQGVFVSIVGFIVLFIMAWLLSKIDRRAPQKYSVEEKASAEGAFFDGKKFNKAWFIGVVLLFFIGGFSHLHAVEPVLLKAPLEAFPYTIGEWKGEEVESHYERPFKIQGADFEMIRIYRNPSGREVTLYVGYYESQRQDKKLSPYSLRRLYRAAEEDEIQTDSSGVVRVNHAILKENPDNLLVLFWYNLDGKVITNRYELKYVTAFDGLIRGRTNGAMISVFSSFKNQGEKMVVLNDEVEFIRQTLPLLDKHFP